MKKTIIFTATLLGIGYVPFFPGTIASLVTASLYFVVPEKILIFAETDIFAGFICLLLFVLSIFIMDEAESYLGKDNRKIVLDEFWGFIIAMLFIPKTLVNIVIAFILFRIFDIMKVWPVNKMEKINGGLGIMADDIMAGIYANVGVRILTEIIK